MNISLQDLIPKKEGKNSMSIVEIVVITVVIVGLLFFILLNSFVSIDQKKRAVVQRFGKYHKYLEPGLNFKLPFIDKVLVRDIREDTIEIEPQEVITKDNVEIRVDGVFWCRVHPSEEAVKKSFYEIDNYIYALKKFAQTNIREEYGKMDFDEALTSREQVGRALITVLQEKVNTWGVDITAVEIQSIDPPSDIKVAMHKEKTAEQERRAVRKKALGKREAAEQDKLSSILKAEGEAQGILLKAEAKAEAIRNISEAAEKYFTDRAEAQKKLDVIQNTFSTSSKLIIPSNSSILSTLGLDKVMNMNEASPNQKK
ncbi:MAG: SPFH domain-containing protein [Promethearchaeota archaeon]